jgi:arylsulfatase A-like enzyme
MPITNGISRIGWMTGGKAALWKDEEMADVFTSKALQFIEANRSRPFFLFFSLHDPHVPRVPHPRFVGKTTLGPRGDAIVQADWCAGQVVAALDRLGLARNTLVIFTSDNGPVVNDGYQDDAVARLGSHKPGGSLRGGKYSNFEAGTRVPFIVRWPGQVKAGLSDALASQVDFPASFAAFTKQTLGEADAPDSFDVIGALLGKEKNGRDHLVEQASALSLRVGPWKYIEPGKGQRVNKNNGIETGNDPDGQLYDLATDPGERTNVAGAHPDRVKDMAARLRQIRESGRSRTAVAR